MTRSGVSAKTDEARSKALWLSRPFHKFTICSVCFQTKRCTGFKKTHMVCETCWGKK